MRNEPGLGNDDIVEGGVAFTEAGEADFENHCSGVRGKKLRERVNKGCFVLLGVFWW